VYFCFFFITNFNHATIVDFARDFIQWRSAKKIVGERMCNINFGTSESSSDSGSWQTNGIFLLFWGGSLKLKVTNALTKRLRIKSPAV